MGLTGEYDSYDWGTNFCLHVYHPDHLFFYHHVRLFRYLDHYFFHLFLPYDHRFFHLLHYHHRYRHRQPNTFRLLFDYDCVVEDLEAELFVAMLQVGDEDHYYDALLEVDEVDDGNL